MTTEKSKFNIGHTPIGTVAEFTVVHSEPVIATITEIHATGPKTYILVTDLPGKVTEFQSFSLFWVTKIIKRGTGGSKVAQDRYQANADYAKEYIELYEAGARLKSKSDYATMYARHVVFDVAQKYSTDQMWLDGDKLMELVVSAGLLGFKPLGEHFHYVTINKKKLHRLVKQNINRCLKDRQKAQDEEDKEMDEYYANEMRLDTRDLFNFGPIEGEGELDGDEVNSGV